jgi:hypothetical protein
MKRTTKWAIAAAAGMLLTVPPAIASPGHGEHDHDYEYQDADCTPIDDAAGDDSIKLFEERAHHGNGRTECVLVDGSGTPVEHACPGDEGDDCYIAYDPYQEDTVEGNSRHDRGPAVRYHNGDKYGDGGHHAHGDFGCWNKNEGSPVLGGGTEAENAAEEEAGVSELQALLWEAVAPYTGTSTGYADAWADGWYSYPVAASKSFHMVRTSDSATGDGWHGRVEAANVESFMIAMTDEGWQPLNGMFMLGNEGPVKDVYADEARTTLRSEFDKDGDGYIDRHVDGIDFKRVEEQHLPLWESPTTPGLVCDLPWHGHFGHEGVATSFDAENPDASDWMAHLNLYASEGDPWGMYQGADGAEPHAYWEPYRRIPAACNPSGPCL